MQINTTHYLRSFSEFCKELESENINTGCAVNVTAKPHCGWDTNLYECQDGFIAVVYRQDRVWEYHFNGYVGEGLTLQDAIADHKEKYKEYLHA